MGHLTRSGSPLVALCIVLGCNDPTPRPQRPPSPASAPASAEAPPAERTAAPSDTPSDTSGAPSDEPPSTDSPPPEAAPQAPTSAPAATLALGLGAADESAVLAQANANVEGRAYLLVLYEGRGRFFERHSTEEALEDELARLRAGCDEDSPEYERCIARVAGGDRHLLAALGGGEEAPGAELLVAKVRQDRRTATYTVEARVRLVAETRGPPSEDAPLAEIRVRDFDRDGVTEASVTYAWMEPRPEPRDALITVDRAQTAIFDLRALAVQAVVPRYLFDDRGNNEGVALGAVYRFTDQSADGHDDLAVRAVAGFGNDCPFEGGFPRMGVPGWCSIERAAFTCPYDTTTDRWTCAVPEGLAALVVVEPTLLGGE